MCGLDLQHLDFLTEMPSSCGHAGLRLKSKGQLPVTKSKFYGGGRNIQPQGVLDVWVSSLVCCGLKRMK